PSWFPRQHRSLRPCSISRLTAAAPWVYPQYTRPQVYKGLAVPEVLRSGDHGKVDQWRREEAIKITRKLRPDLLGEE
ncbi:MAG: hypothetical protein IJB97_07215, partial [Clostridia bacterium]|nr:hypothetical protein [Clostridia bacterium]